MSKYTSPRKIIPLLILLSIILIFASSAFSQPSPPVDITFTLEDAPQLGVETILKLRVTPFEDMHAEISCLLPEGIKPVREKGVMVRPCRDRHSLHLQHQQQRYRESIVFYIGPLTQGIAKEFVFRVTIPNKGNYELLASVEALAKWGVKEETLLINAN